MEPRKELAPKEWPKGWGELLSQSAWRLAMRKAIDQKDLPALLKCAEPWMGLEIHLRLKTGRKLFCPQGALEAGWVDAGLPGALPLLDEEALIVALEVGRALGASLSEEIGFERKRYGYPDLSKGWQTTQKGLCVFKGGEIAWPGGRARIERGQVEEDAGQARRDGEFFEVDFARAGSPLLEVVTEAQPMLPSEAALCAKALWLEAVHGDFSEARPEKGEFKTDLNISLRPLGALGLGEKTEIKGVGSFEFARLGAEEALWMLAEELLAQTPSQPKALGFDEAKGACFLMREKGDDRAYKFLPDGDLRLRRASELALREGQFASWGAESLFWARAAAKKEETAKLLADPRKSRICAYARRLSGGDCADQDGLVRSFFAKARHAPDALWKESAKALGWALAREREGEPGLDCALGALGETGFCQDKAEEALRSKESQQKSAREKMIPLWADFGQSEKGKAALDGFWGAEEGKKDKARSFLMGQWIAWLKKAGLSAEAKEAARFCGEKTQTGPGALAGER